MGRYNNSLLFFLIELKCSNQIDFEALGLFDCCTDALADFIVRNQGLQFV